MIFFLGFILFHIEIKAQCSYNIINVAHVDCFQENTGSIDISISNSNATYWWTSNNGFSSANNSISNLYAGDYVINIVENTIPGDTSSSVICSVSDTITIHQTIQITAEFTLKNMCSFEDSVDVFTSIYGGTRPYSTLWTQIGDTSRSITNVPPSNIPYTLNIIDANGCQRNQYLTINQVDQMQTFMSVENLICKDDNSASARVFVTNGTPPFVFTWNTGEINIHGSESEIYGLSPGIYTVSIKDTMGCSISDSISIHVNPQNCIKIYKVFSPNEDGINDFWKIENIDLYPEALVEIYDRLGNRVYSRRNYINAESIAFNGKKDSRRLPSGTYYYVVNLENEDQVLKGTVTLIR